jgi:serine/threonine protein kinase
LALAPGTRLGPYEILSAIGAGGMGEVYRARDTRLDRDVALKILPDRLASDPQFCERFEREARTISQLSHPHICPLFDVGHHDGVHFLVMEFLDGDTLADRLKRGPLPVNDALRIGREIAMTLDVAHRQGIVHRDLKPGNVMLTKAGAKLLDFGLAKTSAGQFGGTRRDARSVRREADLTSPPTMTTPLTQAGALLGTVQYMSPEQLEGAEADPRSDIFAFGAMLFEMLTGNKAFAGKSQVGVMAAILEHDPPSLSAVMPSASPALTRLVATCLAKDPEARWQDSRDLARELEWIAASPTASVNTAVPSDRWRLFTYSASIGAALAIASAAVTWSVAHWGSPHAQPVRFAVVAPHPIVPGFTNQQIAISPDGTHIAYVTGLPVTGLGELMVRRIDQLDSTRLESGTRDARSPFFSPDGKWIGYFGGGGRLVKISVAGGAAVDICRTSGASRGAAWGLDDTIVFATGSTGLQTVPARGGEPKPLTKPDLPNGEGPYGYPEFVPDAHAVLFTALPASMSLDAAQIVALDLRTGQRKVLIRGGSSARYLDTGYLLYAANNTLRAVRFDPAKLEVLGDPIPVLEGVMNASGAAQFAVSKSGALVYVPGDVTVGGAGTSHTLTWVDRQGHEQPIDAPPRAYVSARLSPDATRIALDSRDQEQDVWILILRAIRCPDSRWIGRRTDSPSGRPMVAGFTSSRAGTASFECFGKLRTGLGQPSR